MAEEVKYTNQQLLSALYEKKPFTWADRINITDKTLWSTAKALISSADYSQVRNEIFDDLVNLIGLQKLHKTTFNNPLKQFRTGEMPTGDTLQIINVDTVQAKNFAGGELDQFKKAPAQVEASYHRINRQQYYPITIDDPRMIRAFNTEFGLQELVNEIVSKLSGSNEIDEYIFTKQLIEAYRTNTSKPIKTAQVIEVPNLMAKGKTTADVLEFVEIVKRVIRRMQFANRTYNAAEVSQQSHPAELSTILNTDISVINEVYNISRAFHPTYADVNVPIIGVDQLSDVDTNIVGVILDNSAIKIYDTLRRLTSSENALGLYRNYFYHIQQLYAFNPFANAVFIKQKASE